MSKRRRRTKDLERAILRQVDLDLLLSEIAWCAEDGDPGWFEAVLEVVADPELIHLLSSLTPAEIAAILAVVRHRSPEEVDSVAKLMAILRAEGMLQTVRFRI